MHLPTELLEFLSPRFTQSTLQENWGMSWLRLSRPRIYSPATLLASNNHNCRYGEQDAIVDMVFPPIGNNGLDPEVDVEQFSSFPFWRPPLMDISTLDLEDLWLYDNIITNCWVILQMFRKLWIFIVLLRDRLRECSSVHWFSCFTVIYNNGNNR